MMQMDRYDSMTDESSYKLEFFFSCRNLADLDFITVTDSFLVVKMQEQNKAEKVILKTKVYDNNLNPDYAETLTLDYFFQIRQNLKIQVFHQSNPPKLVGSVTTSVGEIFGTVGNSFRKPINNEKSQKSGEILIRCEKVDRGINQMIQFRLEAYDLPAESGFCCFGSSADTFYRIYRKRQKDELLIYESEVVYDQTSPKFKVVELSERRLNKNSQQQLFDLRFYTYSRTGAHSLIGIVKTNINNIIDARKLKITDSKGRNKGVMNTTNVQRYVKNNFVDYVYAGLQMLLITCIDFTASNGIAKAPTSLHYFQPNVKRSQYEEALEEVSKILLDYDSDKLVPVYGFGAKCNFPTFNSYGKVNHCFPLNGNSENAHVFHVEGIINAYRNALMYLQFGGPTQFNHLLHQAILQAKQLQKQVNQYMIVFILTDGQIHDKPAVIDQIIACGRLPLSIIIVGIGNGPFDIMEELDDDDCQLRDSKGNRTIRDLVQFVEFRKFKNNGMMLAKEVLEELPRQVQQYYKIMNISPMNFPKIPPPNQY